MTTRTAAACRKQAAAGPPIIEETRMTDTTDPQTDFDRRDRYAQAIREATGERWPAQAYWTEADAVIAVADAEQAELRRERDLAIAHDRQPYPTAWAYEQACKALRTHRERADEVEQEVRRLRLMVDEYSAGASALTDKLKRARDMHRETCPFARGGVPPMAFRCGMCEVLDAPAVLPPAADRAAVERVRAVLETEAVVGRSALEYRGLIASALMADEAQQAETQAPCTCAAAGDCFAPSGHYADCPQATPPAVVAEPGKEN